MTRGGSGAQADHERRNSNVAEASEAGGAADGIAAIRRRIVNLRGWPRRGLLALSGACSILAMAPFFLSPVLFLTLPVLVLAIDAAEVSGDRGKWTSDASRRAFGAGWWFGVGYHLAGLFWIGEAFLVEAETFAVLMPFAVAAMPAGLALFLGAATAAAARFWRPGLERVVVLAVAISIAEWLRGHVLTGFPWNILGYALTFPLAFMQVAGLIGIYGLTLVAIIAFTWPGVHLLDGARAESRTGMAKFGAAVLAPFAGLAIIGGLLLGLRTPDADLGSSVRIVQPSVPQREKWQPENQERIFKQHIALSHRGADGRDDGGAGKALILWPEAAMPFLPLNSPLAITTIGEMLPAGTILASGALRADASPPEPGERRRIFNSLLLFGAGGHLAASYDKIHLVPFGEYLPLQPWLEAIGLRQLTKLRGGFAVGERPRPNLSVPGLPLIGPLICYEAIFPGAAVQRAERPAVLVNVTNDGWFGNTSGPRQHLHQARVRAVEEGLPLLRSANNGISAIVDAQGRVRASLGMNVVGVIDGAIPGAGRRTLYSVLGDSIFLGMLCLCVGSLILRGNRQD